MAAWGHEQRRVFPHPPVCHTQEQGGEPQRINAPPFLPKVLIFPSEKSNGIERKIPGDKLETEQFKFQCDHYAHHQQRKETDHIFYLDLQARDDPIAQPHQQHDKE
jgi:hypothetical protein